MGLIEFKNGATIVSSQYWREDGQIKFYHHGGLVGVSADLVKEVRDTELPVPDSAEPGVEGHNQPEFPSTVGDAPSGTEDGDEESQTEGTPDSR